MSCTSTGGGTRPPRRRPPTARTASGSAATCRSTPSSAPVLSRSASTPSWPRSGRSPARRSAAVKAGSPACPPTTCSTWSPSSRRPPSMTERPLWSEQFLGMLEALRMPAQFQQGRRYARSGRVPSLSISTSLVTGLVQDDDGVTYRARVAVRAFSAADWHRIERALAGEALYTARLLAGELPADLD